MVWILVWAATIGTFGGGAKQAFQEANKKQRFF